MPTNINVPFFKPGQDITGYVAEVAIGGKRFVSPVSGGRGGQPHIGPTPAGAAAMGVAGHDQEPGLYVHVNVGGTVPVTTGADITAGTRVQAGAGGTAVPYVAGADNVVLGLATADAVSGAAVPVQLNLG